LEACARVGQEVDTLERRLQDLRQGEAVLACFPDADGDLIAMVIGNASGKVVMRHFGSDGAQYDEIQEVLVVGREIAYVGKLDENFHVVIRGVSGGGFKKVAGLSTRDGTVIYMGQRDGVWREYRGHDEASGLADGVALDPVFSSRDGGSVPEAVEIGAPL
jgi:hypothetical protein